MIIISNISRDTLAKIYNISFFIDPLTFLTIQVTHDSYPFFLPIKSLSPSHDSKASITLTANGRIVNRHEVTYVISD
ncbi:MAG: hypothetical protein ACW99Q_08200 [Candidatus Kariarchaeaceae archaeon]|jgi:hypothetical protein